MGSLRRIEARVHSIDHIGHRQVKMSQDQARAFGAKANPNAPSRRVADAAVVGLRTAISF